MDNNYTEKDIISILENPFICQLSNTEYGKMVQSAAEEYIDIADCWRIIIIIISISSTSTTTTTI